MINETPWWKARTYSHIKVPKALFRSSYYAGVSPMAKLLYGFLLDRTSLSFANGEDWQNEKDEFFVYYPITEIMERLGCGHDKASQLLCELERSGLITRTLQGRGRPYRIVVQPFDMSAEVQPPKTGEFGDDGIGKSDRNKPEDIKPDLNKPDAITDRAAVESSIKQNVSYDVLFAEMQKEQLDGIVSLIVDTICTRHPTVRIAGEPKPRSEVCRRFWALDDMHIRYVHDRLKEEKDVVQYPRGYILARLYEAADVMDSYYQIRVNHDLAVASA